MTSTIRSHLSKLLSTNESACEILRYRIRAVESARKAQGVEQQELHLAQRYPRRRNAGRLLTQDERELYERYPQFADEDYGNPKREYLKLREQELIGKITGLIVVQQELNRVGTLLGCERVTRNESDQHLFAHTFEKEPYIAAKKYREDTDDPYAKGVYQTVDWDAVHEAQKKRSKVKEEDELIETTNQEDIRQFFDDSWDAHKEKWKGNFD